MKFTPEELKESITKTLEKLESKEVIEIKDNIVTFLNPEPEESDDDDKEDKEPEDKEESDDDDEEDPEPLPPPQPPKEKPLPILSIAAMESVISQILQHQSKNENSLLEAVKKHFKLE